MQIPITTAQKPRCSGVEADFNKALLGCSSCLPVEGSRVTDVYYYLHFATGTRNKDVDLPSPGGKVHSYFFNRNRRGQAGETAYGQNHW